MSNELSDTYPPRVAAWLADDAIVAVRNGRAIGGPPIAIGSGGYLFSELEDQSIPSAITMLIVSGWGELGQGAGAIYIADDAVDATFVAANPRWSVMTNAGSRGWRLYDQQHLIIQFFGGKADGGISASLGGILGTRGATDNAPALVAAIAFHYGNAQFSGSDFFVRSSPPIRFPAADGVYDFYSAVEWRSTIRLLGDGARGGGGETSILRWGPGMHGLVAHFFLSDLSGPLAHYNYTATGSIIEGLCIFQHRTGNHFNLADDKYHGIFVRAAITIRDCNVKGWSGAGVYGLGGTPDTNVNICNISNCFLSANEHGLWLDGGDANVWVGISLDCQQNRGYGVFDSSFLGNTWIACHTDSNGVKSTGDTSSVCAYMGNLFYVRPGQTVGASTNAPPSSATSNTYWGYISAGGAGGGYIAWTSGLTWREGGAYRTDSTGNVRSTFLGCYSEGTNGASYWVYPTFVIGGLHNAPTESLGASIFDNSLGNTLLTTPFSATTSLRVNNTIVVGTRKTGWAVDTGTSKRTANATYSGTAGATYDQTIMQAAMDALRDATQTIKALKDDLHATAGHGMIGT